MSFLLDIMLLAGMGLMAMLYVREKGKTKVIMSLFGQEFIKSLRTRRGILFLRFDTSGEANFHHAPWTHKDESFYYIELQRGGQKEKFHHKVRKKDLFRLGNRINMAIVVEESISSISPEIAKVFSDLSSVEKARMVNSYIKYHSLKAREENLLQALRFEANPEKIESLKTQLEEIHKEMASIREKWAAIVQEVDLDSVIVIPDEKEKKMIILRPVRIDELSEYLEATRPDEIIYTAKKIFIDWQQVALESLKKLITPVKKASGSKGGLLTMILLGGGLLLLLLLVMGMMGR